jgi:hypothetical protein
MTVFDRGCVKTQNAEGDDNIQPHRYVYRPAVSLITPSVIISASQAVRNNAQEIPAKERYRLL